MNDEVELNQARQRIDELDRQLQELLTKRAALAVEVAEIKRRGNDDAQFYRPEREAQILREVARRNGGPLSNDTLVHLFREIISACLALEQSQRVAYLGPEGTFTQEAALKHFGHSIDSTPLATIDEVFRAVEAGEAAFGVVPIENSTEGVVNHTLDLFLRSPLRICGEIELRVHHHLLSQAAGLADIQRVFAHQQALAQCREWLARSLPGRELVAVSSNAEAARLAAAEPDAAAIASQPAAERYGVASVAANIEDEPDNTTRFLVIGLHEVGASGEDKTSLVMSTRNIPGALFKLLEPLARRAISMTKIESRPSRLGKWEYVFFIDLQGHRDDPEVAAALAELEKQAALFRILGSYPSVAR